jgi:zinc transport system substrate-binding protein
VKQKATSYPEEKYIPMKKLLALFFLLIIAGIPGSAFSAPFDVFVSVLPQKYFLEKIGGKHLHVLVMVPPGASPATYEPKPGQMAALSTAKAYFSIGVPFEKTWLPRIMGLFKHLPVIQTGAEIKKQPLWHPRMKEGEKDDPGRYAERSNGLDPHIWTSPPLVMLQARTILNGLSLIDPSHTSDYATNYRTFIEELVNLDLEIRKILLPRCRGKRFLVFHPSWGYFARAYGLKQIAIEREGKAPGPRHLEELINFAREKKIRAVFIQPQFSRKSAGIIARAIGARIVSADPLAEDWEQNLKHVATDLRNTLDQP